MKEPSRDQIWKMFDQISPTYDRVNRVMTYGLDCYWRKKVSQRLPRQPEIRLLDLATGTADQIISIMKRSSHIKEAVGIDLAKEMLEIGRQKILKWPFASKVSLQEASALALPFPDESFDCVTMSFGIRNVTDVDLALKEIRRVLKQGGRALILEGTLPTHKVAKKLSLFYLRHLLPRIGGWISKNKQAYLYLNQTIETFPSGEQFCRLMANAGLSQMKATALTFGTVTLYQGEKL